MRILLVHSGNKVNSSAKYTYVYAQGTALSELGHEVRYFAVSGKGWRGYLRNRKLLCHAIAEFKPNIVHAHFGLCGLLANLQRQVPVITTFHGSDINSPKIRPLARMAMWMSAHNIFISQKTMHIMLGNTVSQKNTLLPCGITLPPSASELPNMSHVLEPCKKHVLFAGAFDNAVKDPNLAKQVISILNQQPDTPIQLLELKGYTRDEVSALMYACDAFLMTSKTEGSPQVIKEAMVCGCPIVSVDVGDVAERTAGLEGCFVSNSRDPKELADLLSRALAYGKRTDGRKLIVNSGLTNDLVAQKLIQIYQNLKK